MACKFGVKISLVLFVSGLTVRDTDTDLKLAVWIIDARPRAARP